MAAKQLESGCFFVTVDDVRLDLPQPAPAAAVEGEEEEVPPPQPTSVRTTVAVEGAPKDVWGKAQDATAECVLAGGTVAGTAASATSQLFGLSEAQVSDMLAATVRVTLVHVVPEGPDAPAKDVQLASLTLPLAEVLTTSAPVFTATLALGEAPLPKPQPEAAEGEEAKAADPAPPEDEEDTGPLRLNGSTSSVTITMSLDDDLCDFVLGGTVLALAPATLEALPAPWTMTPPPDTPPEELHAKLVEMVQGPERTSQKFTLASGEGAVLADLAFEPGQWQYSPPAPAVPAEAAAAESPAEGQGEDGTGAAAETSGAWSVHFPAPAPRFLTRSSRLNLKAALQDGDAALQLELVRKGGSVVYSDDPAPTAKGKGKKPAGGGAEPAFTVSAEEDWTVSVAVSLASLLEPGECAANVPATLATVLSDEAVAAFDAAQAEYDAAVAAAAAPAGEEGEGADGKAGPAEGDAVAPPPTPPVDRAGALTTAGSAMAVTLTLTAPLVLAPLEGAGKKLTMGDVLPPPPAVPKRPARDYAEELRAELTEMVRTIAEEYALLFPPEQDASPSTEDKKKQLLYSLNTSGVYHQCKEKLKPRIQRLVRAKFENQPSTQDEADRFVSQLYLQLMHELSKTLRQAFTRASDAQEPQVAGSLKPVVADSDEVKVDKLTTDLTRLQALADDAEANGDVPTATARHEDRTALVTAPEEDAPKRPPEAAFLKQKKTLTTQAWLDFANFSLRTSKGAAGEEIGQWRAKAAQCLVRALHLTPDDVAAVRLYGCVLLEQGKFEESEAVLESALALELPSLAVPTDERSPEQLAMPDPLSNMVACVHRTKVGKFGEARQLLTAAVTGCLNRTATADPADVEGFFGKPRRTAVFLAVQACQMLTHAGLPDSAAVALEIADKAETAAKSKAERRSLPTALPPLLKQRASKARAELALLVGDLDGALAHVSTATDLDPKDGAAWLVCGDVHHAAARLQDAAFAMSTALDLLSTQRATVEGSILRELAPSPPPLRLFVRLGALYLQMSQVVPAQDVFLQGCDAWQSCSMWLGVGIALLRTEQFDDAEDALMTANIRNTRSAVVWGYLSLCCLARGDPAMVPQADNALTQAQRLGLADALLLRELGNSYESIDLLERAEELFRRSLACDDAPHTRRRLADVLSAQNALAAAIEEYKQVLATSEDAREVEIALAESERLLAALGRTEEIESLRALRSSM